MLDYQDPPNYEFRLATNQDARSSMSQELENILRSCPGRCCQEIRFEYLRVFFKGANSWEMCALFFGHPVLRKKILLSLDIYF